tara:strand:- start:7821 stop:8009 length:189 start_codon:yes stop_codon:yes gene_type:complete
MTTTDYAEATDMAQELAIGNRQVDVFYNDETDEYFITEDKQEGVDMLHVLSVFDFGSTIKTD